MGKLTTESCCFTVEYNGDKPALHLNGEYIKALDEGDNKITVVAPFGCMVHGASNFLEGYCHAPGGKMFYD